MLSGWPDQHHETPEYLVIVRQLRVCVVQLLCYIRRPEINADDEETISHRIESFVSGLQPS